ncbi:Uu.00g006910.m01.CDS01 [Anthostomella pinea]|uniref:Uu.00g006910.m01.CDS01 n=1 Tax=Anthostomella pinea TaxID=933095 RepID=A0AAI8VKF0_9PEZI|nr:Uu.00g006910.m01.CDS01 [Anthostomella pinea]
MASQQQSPGASAAAYKRASRKGAPRKFSCDRCEKVYSRAEHLQRHQLNHDPKEIYRCDVADCTQMFVRPDLLARHKKRHSASYIPRNRTSSFSVQTSNSPSEMSVMASPSAANNGHTVSAPAPALISGQAPLPPSPATYSQRPVSAPRNASVLMTSDSPIQSHPRGPPSLPGSQVSPITPGSSWGTPMEGVKITRPKPNFYGHEPAPMHDPSTFVPFHHVQIPTDPNDLAQNDFGMWLFNSQRNYGDFTNIPFLEGGLESPFNNNIHYDRESLTSRSQVDVTPPRHADMPDELISEYRRHEVIRWIQMFRQKQNKYNAKLEKLMLESGGDIPRLSLDFFRDCIRHYWDFVSPRLPIVHQPTFSSTTCSIHLLLVIIALGAAQLHNQSDTDDLEEYKILADLIITSVRFEILTTDEASPPVGLWVAQALLLLEFYEKMYSSRKLHERAHIYHSATLTLLRRGSPLIGRAGSESPPDQQEGPEHPAASDARTWWIRWAETESMHRVVFAAFMMDVVHAAMFGHAADMAPHEIRLPLPCDESLWSASSPDIVRNKDANLRMYGVKPVSFLDGLKHAIHGKEVKTHSLGRMIIMCGLLSVGWHLRHRETHLKWLELGSNTAETRERWCRMLLKAFDDWKTSFDKAIGLNDSELGISGQQSGSNGLIQSAALLYHLAHISLYIDIVDCQVYTGAKQLLGRKVSTRDYTNVVSRMTLWAAQVTTRRAILHAFKLLHRILVDPRQRKNIGQSESGIAHGIQYSTRTDADPHRPWLMYYATLSIWSFVRALEQSKGHFKAVQPFSSHLRRNSNGVPEYLSRIAQLNELDLTTSRTLQGGLSDLLDTVGTLASESHSELLNEACGRLEVCKETIHSDAPPP